MNHLPKFKCALAAAGIFTAVALVGCGESESASSAQSNTWDTSYLDDLEKSSKPAPRPIEEEPEKIAAAPQPETELDDPPERDFEAQRTSKSSLGITRDMAKDLRNDLQGGTTSGGVIAETFGDDHYVNVGYLRWDLPDDWLVIIPGTDAVKAEILIKSAFGNMSAVFIESPLSPSRAISQIADRVLDQIGSAVRPRKISTTIAGLAVTTFEMEGTYLEGPPRGPFTEKIFYAVRGITVERPGKPLVVAWLYGTENGIQANQALWDQMILDMTSG